ncbi:general transcription factor IIE subunit 1-like [Styela clava]
MSNTLENESEVLREVPDALQRLIRYVARGFYGLEHGLVIDVLVRNACVKEDDIQELLKMDKKQLRAMLVFLKNDKILKARLCVETQPDGNVLRHNYYYINYRSICNIIKYKLHHIHKKIETQERDSTNRSSFRCPTCQNTYSDLDIKLLIDPFLGTLNCTYCKSEVEEDVSAEAAQDSRTLQAKFNEQMEPIYKLLRETENVNLSIEVLEPEPTIIPHLHPNAKPSQARQRGNADKSGSGHWTDVKSGGLDYHQDVIIDIGDNPKEDTTQAKEVPIWIQESTINKNVDATSAAISSISGGTSSVQDRLKSPTRGNNTNENDEVLAMLMMQERRNNTTHGQSSSGRYNDGGKSDTSESDGEDTARNRHGDEEDDDDDDFEEVDDNDPVIMVAGKPYSYSEVAQKGQQLVQLMTSVEKAAYIEIGQQMYEDMQD